MKSFYTVSLALTGGYYRDSAFTYGALADLQRALEWEFWHDLREGDQLVLSYGDVPLETYIGGELKQTIDLMPFVTVRGANGVVFTPAGHEWREYHPEKWTIKGTDVCPDEEFCKSAVLWLDWGAAPVLALEEPVLEQGEEAEGRQEYRGQLCQSTYRHGYENIEAGEEYDREYEERMESDLAIDPDWLTFNGGAVRALAESMHATGDYSAMPILADALQEAGCENELFLWHCRGPACVYARGSWLVERLRRGVTGGEESEEDGE